MNIVIIFKITWVKKKKKALELYDFEYWDHPWEKEARKLAASNRLKIFKRVIL